jgi:hypothetical protein
MGSVKGVSINGKKRKCLNCDTPFLTTPEYRLCAPCRLRSEEVYDEATWTHVAESKKTEMKRTSE